MKFLESLLKWLLINIKLPKLIKIQTNKQLIFTKNKTDKTPKSTKIQTNKQLLPRSAANELHNPAHENRLIVPHG